MNSLVLITRPIHAFCFANYYHSKVQKGSIYKSLVISANPSELSAILKILELASIRPTYVFPRFRIGYSVISILFVYIFILAHKLFNIKFKQVMLSGGVKARAIYKLLSFEQLIFIDEGTSSKWRIPNIIKYDHPYPPASKSKNIYYLFGLNKLKKKQTQLLIYTFFDFEENKIIAKNDLLFWKNLCVSFYISNNEALILGTNPVSLRVSDDAYINIVNRIAVSLGYERILYKPHRLFKKKVELLTNELRILNTNLPIELHFIICGFFPELIVSFGSTASEILSIIKPQIKFQNIDLKNEL